MLRRINDGSGYAESSAESYPKIKRILQQDTEVPSEYVGNSSRLQDDIEMSVSSKSPKKHIVSGKYGYVKSSDTESLDHVGKTLPSGRRRFYKIVEPETVELQKPRGYTEARNYQRNNSQRRDVATILPVIPPIVPDEKSSQRRNTASYMVIPPVDPTRTGQGQKDKNQIAYAAPNINDYLDMMEV